MNTLMGSQLSLVATPVHHGHCLISIASHQLPCQIRARCNVTESRWIFPIYLAKGARTVEGACDENSTDHEPESWIGSLSLTIAGSAPKVPVRWDMRRS